MTRPAVARFAAAVALLGAYAASPALPRAAAGDAPAGPVFASAAGYWEGFKRFWTESLQKQNGVVMAILVVGAVCLFIITRAKWKK